MERTSGALMHVVAAVCAAVLPLLLLLPWFGQGDESGDAWEAFDRIDIVVLVFAVIAVVVTAVAYVGQRRQLMLAVAGLLFAAFGMLVATALEYPPLFNNLGADLGLEIGAWLSIVVALVGAGAAVAAREQPLAAPDATEAEAEQLDPGA